MLLLVWNLQLDASTINWDGATAAWNVSTNWSPNHAFSSLAGNDLIVGALTATAAGTQVNGGALTIESLSIVSGVYSVTVLSGNELTIASGDSVNGSSSGTLISASGAALTISGTYTQTGTISGGGAITNTGTISGGYITSGNSPGNVSITNTGATLTATTLGTTSGIYSTTINGGY